MGVVLYLISVILPVAWSPWQQLLILVICGIGIYTTLMIKFRVSAWKELSGIVFEKLLARRSNKMVGQDV
jgi:uncharacterized membrane protein